MKPIYTFLHWKMWIRLLHEVLMRNEHKANNLDLRMRNLNLTYPTIPT